MVQTGKTTNLTIKIEQSERLKSNFERLNVKGDKSFTQWVIEQLDALLEKQEFMKIYAPFLEFVTIHGESLLIKDTKKNIIAEIILKSEKLFCNSCGVDDCEHVDYALMANELGRLIKHKGKNTR